MSWFYFDVPKKEPVGITQQSNISQIPMIGNSDELTEAERQAFKPVFRPTDTKYIMLCKMGGRQDLLTFKDKKTPSDSPVGYPRCDWFYLEDNALEDNINKEDTNYVPRQPDYMVHNYERDNVPKGVGVKPRERYPYALDMNRSEKLEMKIPEPRKFGHGVRLARQKNKAAKQGTTLPVINNPKGRSPTRESQPTMARLMSNYYCK